MTVSPDSLLGELGRRARVSRSDIGEWLERSTRVTLSQHRRLAKAVNTLQAESPPVGVLQGQEWLPTRCLRREAILPKCTRYAWYAPRPWPTHENPPGGGGPTVYFVGARALRRIKIGFTSCLSGRFGQLIGQGGAPCQLDLLAWFNGDRADERSLHRHFASSIAFRKEWFHSTPELVHLITRIRADSSGFFGDAMAQDDRISLSQVAYTLLMDGRMFRDEIGPEHRLSPS